MTSTLREALVKAPLALICAYCCLVCLACGGGAAYVWASEVPQERASLPPASEIIRPGDVVAVTVAGQATLSGQFTVGADGTVTLPDVGPVPIGGKRPNQAVAVLAARVATIIESPRVSAVVVQRRVEVAVLGQVRTPGKYLLTAGNGIVEAIAMAGGLGEFANSSAIYLVRESEPVRIRFRMKDLVAGGTSARSFPLKDGDLLIVE